MDVVSGIWTGVGVTVHAITKTWGGSDSSDQKFLTAMSTDCRGVVRRPSSGGWPGPCVASSRGVCFSQPGGCVIAEASGEKVVPEPWAELPGLSCLPRRCAVPLLLCPVVSRGSGASPEQGRRPGAHPTRQSYCRGACVVPGTAGVTSCHNVFGKHSL